MKAIYAMLIGGITAVLTGFFLKDVSLIITIAVGILVGFLILTLKKTENKKN